MKQKEANYGVDAPGFILGHIILGTSAVFLAIVIYSLILPARPMLGRVLLILDVLAGMWGFVIAGGFLWSSKVGKLHERDRLMNLIQWRGDEKVLDVGCGRGLMLVEAAKRLTTGKAVGVDVWDAGDESSNRPESTLENARIEGVENRIEVKYGDARQLPLENETFDIVMSSLVLHNIHSKAERKKAICEMVCVLKPGGQIAILDLLHFGEFMRVLDEGGMIEIKMSRPRVLFLVISRIISAKKSL